MFGSNGVSHLSKKSMDSLFDRLDKLEESDVKRSALSFISDYAYADVFVVDLESASLSNWGISSPGKELMLKELKNSKVCFKLTLKYSKECF